MSKSILVIDTPESCIDCPIHFYHDIEDTDWCLHRRIDVNVTQGEKPDWCPLRDVPAKKEYQACLAHRAFSGGFNRAIDEIFQEDKNDN